MKQFLSEARYQFLISGCEQMSISSLWDNLMSDYPAFEERKEPFFWMLERALSEGRLKLKKHGEYLTGTAQEQVEQFRKRFPVSNIPNPDYPDEDASYWFYDEHCPGEAVWRVERPGGVIEWMHCP